MKEIFESGSFSNYRTDSLYEARSAIRSYAFSEGIVTVFLSHKHDELYDLKDIIGFLQKNYKVKVYIDSRDPLMPAKTSGKTAENIKIRIKQCNKFILLATNGAIESKWCNWELGFGDAQKFSDKIALFPIKPKGSTDYEYKGTEYMSIYPYITYFDGSEKYTDGRLINRGYYVRTQKEDGSGTIEPLEEWFQKR